MQVLKRIKEGSVSSFQDFLNNNSGVGKVRAQSVRRECGSSPLIALPLERKVTGHFINSIDAPPTRNGDALDLVPEEVSNFNEPSFGD